MDDFIFYRNFTAVIATVILVFKMIHSTLMREREIVENYEGQISKMREDFSKDHDAIMEKLDLEQLKYDIMMAKMQHREIDITPEELPAKRNHYIPWF